MESIGGIYRRAGAAALASRQSLPTLYSNAGERDRLPAGLPSRVFICGISALPPVYLRALQALGKHIEIHLLFTNPCRYYWGTLKTLRLAKLMARQRRHSFEDRHLPLFRENQNPEALFNSDGEQDIGNPLLASWGKLGRDYIYLLSELENSRELDAFADITPDNLLHRIQADILELESHAVAGVNLEEYSRSDNKRLLDPEDNSLSFHVCHSPQREVEILHDRLLAMLEADPTLTPRDIIVMVADIDSYSPFIRRYLVARQRSAICLMPFPIGGRVSHIRCYRHLSAYFRYRTAALSPRMFWRC